MDEIGVIFFTDPKQPPNSPETGPKQPLQSPKNSLTR